MSPWTTGPHEVTICRFVLRRQVACGEIKRPKNHRVWRTGLIIRIRITSLRLYGMHVLDVRKRLMGLGKPLSCSLFLCIATLSSHMAGMPTPVGSPGIQRHTREVVCSLAKDSALSCGMFVQHGRAFRDVCRGGREGLRNLHLLAFLRMFSFYLGSSAQAKQADGENNIPVKNFPILGSRLACLNLEDSTCLS
jgi:hypothetical protein